MVVTTRSLSFGGVTVSDAPVVGSARQAVLQVNGTVGLGPVFNPLSISATEFNLVLRGTATQVAAKISGTLSPHSTLSWSVYVDTTNNPLGTGRLIASDSFSDPSNLLSVGFFQPPGRGRIPELQLRDPGCGRGDDWRTHSDRTRCANPRH